MRPRSPEGVLWMRHLDPGAQLPVFGAQPLRNQCQPRKKNWKMKRGIWTVRMTCLRDWTVAHSVKFDVKMTD